MYPEYLSDDAIPICPSDADGWNRVESDGWRHPSVMIPQGGISPCHLWEISCKYYGRAIPAENAIIAGTDVNDMPASCDFGFPTGVKARGSATFLSSPGGRVKSLISAASAQPEPGNPGGSFLYDV